MKRDQILEGIVRIIAALLITMVLVTGAALCLQCTTGPDLAAYQVEEAACIQRSTTKESADACRSQTKAAYHAKWCGQGYQSYCSDGGQP